MDSKWTSKAEPEEDSKSQELEEALEAPDWAMIFLNISCTLYYAAMLNVTKLKKDLNVVRLAIPTKNSISGLILENFIQFFILLKYVVHFFSLAAKIIAMLPMLCNDHHELLHPTIFCQLVENLVLPLVELALGFIAVEFTIVSCKSRLPLYTICMVLRVAARLIVLNVYLNFHSKISTESLFAYRSLLEANENLWDKPSLAYAKEEAN